MPTVFIELGKIGCAQLIYQFFLGGTPDFLERAILTKGAFSGIISAIVQLNWPIDGFHDIQHGYLRRRKREGYTPVSPARRMDDAGDGELGDDLRQETGWDLLRLGDEGG